MDSWLVWFALQVAELRQKTPELFGRIDLYLAVHSLLARFRFPLQVRQSIHALFTDASATFAAPDDRGRWLASSEAPSRLIASSEAPPGLQPLVAGGATANEQLGLDVAGGQRRSVRL